MKKKVHHSSTFLMHFHRQNEISAFCVRENEAFSSRNEKGKYFATSQENYTLLLRWVDCRRWRMSDDDIVYFFVALNRMLLARSYNKRLIFPISFRASMRGNFKIPIEKCNAIYTIMKIFLSLSSAFCAIESFFFAWCSSSLSCSYSRASFHFWCPRFVEHLWKHSRNENMMSQSISAGVGTKFLIELLCSLRLFIVCFTASSLCWARQMREKLFIMAESLQSRGIN